MTKAKVTDWLQILEGQDLPRTLTLADFPVGCRVRIKSYGYAVSIQRVGLAGTVVKHNRTTVSIRLRGYDDDPQDFVRARPSQIARLSAV